MTTEASHQDWPNLHTRQDAKHWKITKSLFKFFFRHHPPQHPLIERKSMLYKAPLPSAHKPRWTCHRVPKVPVFKCTPPPYVWTGKVNKSTTTLTNCMWTTVPQNVYYRLKAWNAVSTLLRASNLSLEIDLQHTSPHHLASGAHWSPMQHPPPEREGFSKTDSTQYCNSRDTQDWEGSSTSSSPHQCTKFIKNEIIKDYLNYSDKNKKRNWRWKKQNIQKDEARRNTETKQTI